MATTTTRLGLYKPDPSEFVNVTTDLNNNHDSIDSKIGALPCTSGTRPVSPYDGQFIRETDTGKMYVCTNTVGPVWTQVLFGTAQFGNSVDIVGNLTTSGFVRATRATSNLGVLAGRVTGDSVDRILWEAGGKASWGDGTNPADIGLERSSAGVLDLDGSLRIMDFFETFGAADFFGETSIANGQLTLGSARIRPQLGVVQTLANSTSETVLASTTVPANDAVSGALFRLKAWGLASVTGTPTLTLRMRVGGLAGTLYSNMGAISIASGGQNRLWCLEYDIHVLTTGVGGTARYFGRMNHSFTTTTGLPHGTVIPILDASATSSPAFNTTIARDIVITGQWSAASSSNTTTCYFASMERIA